MGEMTMASDKQGLARMAQPNGSNGSGNATAQAACCSDILEAHIDAVYTFVRTRVPPDCVDDIVQEVFTAAIISITRSNGPPASVWHWLLAIARSRIVDHFRRLGRQSHLTEIVGRLASQRERLRQGLIDESALPEDLCQQAELRSLVQTALGALEPDQRACLHARYYEGLALEQIGERMGMSHAAVNSLLYRSRQDLRQELLAMLADPTGIEEYTS
jgi:RNA polymerase sigma-70 factor, ECF subfamily